MTALLVIVGIVVLLSVGFGMRVIWRAILEERVAKRLEDIHREMEL